MNANFKRSRCSFVIIKLNLNQDHWFVMRRDLDWKDVNFIGGHEQESDRRRRKKTAQRELLEEIPALRGRRSFALEPLTKEIDYGPILSRSANCEVKYLIQFFLLRFTKTPRSLLESLRGRTLNLMLSERELFEQKKYRVSGLVRLLDDALPGGLSLIPLSWPEDLGEAARASGIFSDLQLELSLE